MDKRRLLELAGVQLKEQVQQTQSDEETAREILYDILDTIDKTWDPEHWEVSGVFPGAPRQEFAEWKAKQIEDLYRAPGHWMKESQVMRDAVNGYRKRLRVLVKNLVKSELKTIRRERVARKRQRENG